MHFDMAALFLMQVLFMCGCVKFGSGKSLQDVLAYGNELENPFAEALSRHKLAMECGHVEVRRGVAMFWWLWYADGRRDGAAAKPLVVWVQGGPGLPASGIGNFLEIGPLDSDFRKRNHTWVNGHNLLLVDSPAGSGFSTVADPSLYASKDKHIVTDFVNTLVGFLDVHPEFKQTPCHIFSQSYGGKLAPKIGYRLNKRIERGSIEMNLRTVAIGSGFVDPSESISTSADFLFHMGLLDIADYERLKKRTDSIAISIKANRFEEAYYSQLNRYTDIPHIVGVNKNNVNKESEMLLFYQLEHIVNLYVKPVLNATRHNYKRWECLSHDVYYALRGNMLLPSKRYVEKLLNETSLNVVVYNGNFDAVTPMAGCVNWVHKLRWPGADVFRHADRLVMAGGSGGYYKRHARLSMWWVLGAGHWVPNDNPAAMKEILRFATNQ